MDGAELGVELRREKREDVIGGFAFLDLPDRRPIGPDAGEAGEEARLVETGQPSRPRPACGRRRSTRSTCGRATPWPTTR